MRQKKLIFPALVQWAELRRFSLYLRGLIVQTRSIAETFDASEQVLAPIRVTCF